MSIRETLETPHSVEPPVRVYEDPFTAIDRYVARFSSFEKTFYVSRKGTRAAILPIRGGEVLLVRQYRFLINAISLEVIGGKVDPGEDPPRAAARECLEETGYRCENLTHLLSYQPGLDAYDNPTHIYISHDVHQETSSDSDTCRWVSLTDIPKLIQTGELCDSLSLIALSNYMLSLR